MLDNILKILSGNFALKIISIGIAIVLWFYVLGSQQQDATKDIAVDYVVDDGIIPAKDAIEKVQVRLSIPKAFMRVVLNRAEKPILINLKGKPPGWYTSRIFSDAIQVPFGVKVLEVQPREIRVQLEKIRTRTIPVVTEVLGKPPEGYRLGKVEPRPANVTVRGRWDDIKDLKNVLARPVDVNGIVESQAISTKYESEGSRFLIDGDPPSIYVEVVAISPNYKIRNVPIQIVGAERFKISHSQVTVFVRALEEDLKTLDRTKIIAEVDMAKKNAGKYEEKVIIRVPKRISLVKTVPEVVRVIVY